MDGSALTLPFSLPPIAPLAFVTVGTTYLWVGFTVFVLAMLLLDLFVFHRGTHAESMRSALKWSVFWIALSLLFCGGIVFYPWPEVGGHPQGWRLATEFLTGYLIEKALSVDNLFVFLVIFSYFKVPGELQRRVLFWGILGAMIMRALFIVSGAVLLQKFEWLIYIFAAFLTITGFKMLFKGDEDPHPERNPLVRLFQHAIPSTPDFHGARFFVKAAGRWLATPLLLVLITVEVTDLIFAVDSIPAIFGITDDPFIVYTSNIFAILGLRALYFVLASAMGKFHYLDVGLALVLIFVGVKMFLDAAHIYEVHTLVSLGVVALLLGAAVAASLLWPEKKGAKDGPSGNDAADNAIH